MPEDKSIRRVHPEHSAAPAEMFDGHVEFASVHRDEGAGVNQSHVHFHDGAHTHWHYHERGQVLYFTEGRGFAQELGGEVLPCDAGDIIEVPDHTRHIHGAMPGENAAHIAISQGETIWDHDPRYSADN